MAKIFTKSQIKACVKAFIRGNNYKAHKPLDNKYCIESYGKVYHTLRYTDSKGNTYKLAEGYRKTATAYGDILNLTIHYRDAYVLEEPYLELFNALLNYINPRVRFANFGGRLIILRTDANSSDSDFVYVPSGTSTLHGLIRRVIPDFFA